MFFHRGDRTDKGKVKGIAAGDEDEGMLSVVFVRDLLPLTDVGMSDSACCFYFQKVHIRLDDISETCDQYCFE